MSNHIDLGKAGESIACKYLEEKGHRIIVQNYRYKHMEIDIISMDKDVLVFTEIKARSSYALGFPEEAVTKKKQSFLKIAAESYCWDKPQYDKVRFDIVSILIQSEVAKEIVHFEDAFY